MKHDDLPSFATNHLSDDAALGALTARRKDRAKRGVLGQHKE